MTLYVYSELDGADRMIDKYLFNSEMTSEELRQYVFEETKFPPHTFDIQEYHLPLIFGANLIDMITQKKQKQLISKLNKKFTYEELKHLGIEHLYEAKR